MYQEEYKRWLAADLQDADLNPELSKIEGNDEEIKDRFAVALKFGTAGLRGVLGAGTNRMNIYVVRQATQGLANWVKTQGGNQTVAISYDSRLAGRIVEQGPVDDIFYEPAHPYTKGLLCSMPRVDAESYERLIPIEGTPVDMLNPPEGCPFAPRCEHCMKICLKKMPPYVEVGEKHRSACWLCVQYTGRRQCWRCCCSARCTQPTKS